jgi:two-component system chemotaxis sensor kinase CheA
MSDFAGMEDLLQDFLQEAGDLLSDVDNKLVDLERSPDDRRLLNDIFRGFHTIKGGAGFLNATELVTLCHLTENLFDKLRNAEMRLTAGLMDTIMAATQSVRHMFGEIAQGMQPHAAPGEVTVALRAMLEGRVESQPDTGMAAPVAVANEGPDWQALHAAVTGQTVAVPAVTTRSTPAAAAFPAGRAPQYRQTWRCGERRAFRSPCRRASRCARSDHSGRYHAPGSGAQPVWRDWSDEEPPDQSAR